MHDPFGKRNSSFLHISKWNKDNVIAGITTRDGGISRPPFHSLNLGLHVNDNPEDIIQNRNVLASQLNIPLIQWVSGQQVHGTKIAIVTSKDKGKGATSYQDSLEGIDGLITTESDLLLTAFFADCVPLFFYDRKNQIIGLAHAGWRGTVSGMGPAMVEHFAKLGTRLEDLEVVIGPCISGENYEVDDHVINHLPESRKVAPIVTSTGPGHFLLDLKSLHKEMLIEAGILLENIEMTQYCTYEEEELFFSHRRDQGKTGRMLAFMGILDS